MERPVRPRSTARVLALTEFREDHSDMGAVDPKPPSPLHAAIGLAAMLAGAAGTAASTTRRIARAATPLRGGLLRPPVLPERLGVSRAVGALADRGRRVVASTSGDLEQVIAVVVPVVVREVLNTLDLNVIILERVDLDGLVAKVDIAEIIDRVDVDAVVRQVDVDAIVDRVDLDAIVERVDLDRLLARIDLDAIVERVDLDRLLARVDLDAIADRIDVDRLLARIDLDAVVAGVDLDAVVDRLDVVGLAEEVIDEIDLPEIIRESTGSMASQVVRDARMQGIGADEAVAGLVDRLLRRRGNRSTAVETPARAEADAVPDAEGPP